MAGRLWLWTGRVIVENKEIIKDIEGYEGLYQITSHGRVISLPKGDGNGGRSRELKFDLIGNGVCKYHRVTFSVDGKTKRFSVHRLVASAFIPNQGSKPCVNHIDSNPSNNNAKNLEWCTYAENAQHAISQGNGMKACLAGAKAASDANLKRTTDKFKEFLGDRFIDCLNGPHGNVVRFECKDCGNQFDKRCDSVVLSRGGICRACHSLTKRKLKG